VVGLQAVLERISVVVSAVDQGLASDIVNAGDL
jgi:hypothetical protein